MLIRSNFKLTRRAVPALTFLLGAVLVLPIMGSRLATPARQIDSPLALGSGNRMPLVFEASGTQNASSSQFKAQLPGGALFFTHSEVALSIDPVRSKDHLTEEASQEPTLLRMSFLDSNPSALISGSQVSQAKVNYFEGNDPAQWRTNLPTYDEITYSNLYAGIDLHYEGNSSQVKGTYIVAPGVDPRNIAWRYNGASNVALDDAGNLQIGLALKGSGENVVLSEKAPIAWQEINGRRIPVDVQYALAANGNISFVVGSYDSTKPLTVDPALTYSTYLGGNWAEYGYGIVADADGNFYVTGTTNSENFPVRNPIQPNLRGIYNAFVAKFDPQGQPIYITYLGGTALDEGYDIAVDSDGNAYITGWTASTNFPIANAYQPTYGGGFYDAFITKLNPAGSALVFSTFLGGSDAENSVGSGFQSGAIAVDSQRNVYVTGYTHSTNFPVRNAIQPNLVNIEDVFVTKLNPQASDIIWSTYLGGIRNDQAKGIGVDALGNVVIGGFTTSSDFPTVNAVQPNLRATYDAFVTRINAAGTALIYSTYLGGTDAEYVDIGLDATSDAVGNAYLTGFTGSTNFPTTAGAFQPNYNGGVDGFVSKLAPTGSLIYSTYLGGGGPDDGNSVAVSQLGEAFVMGSTQSPNFPTRDPIIPNNRGDDAFVTWLNPGGSDIVFSTFLGGSNGREMQARGAIAVDEQYNIYVTGNTMASDFPTVNAFQPFPGSVFDSFVSRISLNTPTPGPTNTATPATRTPTPTSTPNCNMQMVSGSITESDLLRNGALELDGVASTCADPKDCPGIFSGQYNYDIYPYVNTSNATRCITVLLDGTTCGLSDRFIYSSAYLGSFDPNNACANYLADSGDSSSNLRGPVEYSFEVPAGATFYVLVEESNEGFGCDFYRMRVTGVDSCTTSTVTPIATNTNTPVATATYTPVSTSTNTPISTATNTSVATATSVSTGTSVPPTATRTQVATSTSTVMASATAISCAISFSDVPADSTFYDNIRCLACKGIVSGYADGTFRPDNLVTRGQLAKIVSNAAGFTESPGAQIFEDVPPSNTFYEWINRLTNRGHMSGYACGSAGEPCVNNRPYFRPFANATRAQTSKIVANAARYNDPPTGQAFEDVPPTHPFYAEIQRLASRNIMGGYNCGGPGEPCSTDNKPYFRPYNNVTRGQSTKIVANTFYPNCQTP